MFNCKAPDQINSLKMLRPWYLTRYLTPKKLTCSVAVVEIVPWTQCKRGKYECENKSMAYCILFLTETGHYIW